jgi:competence protein ComEA
VVVGLLAALALGGTALIVWSSQPQQETVGLAATGDGQTTGSPMADPALSPEPGIGPATGVPAAGVPAAGVPAAGVPAAGVSEPRPATPTTVVVHVAGRVASPGVVELPAGSRVVDALDAAGGVLPDTALDAVNLARVLVDGEQVRVGLPPDPAVQSSEPPAAAAGSLPDGPIDLNTATAADLEELPGVGPVLAGRIVAWREENGPFTAVDQLLEVAGIGPAVFDDLDDRVRV